MFCCAVLNNRLPGCVSDGDFTERHTETHSDSTELCPIQSAFRTSIDALFAAVQGEKESEEGKRKERHRERKAHEEKK